MSKDQQNQEKLKEDLQLSINVLEGCIQRYWNKNHEFESVTVAGELRKLVCAGRGNSLLERLKPNIKLPPLIGGPVIEYGPFQTAISRNRIMSFNGKGGFDMGEFFDFSCPGVSLEYWLEQSLITGIPLLNDSKDITFNDLIKSVADKQDAHADADYGRAAKAARTFKFVDQYPISQILIKAGEVVLCELWQIAGVEKQLSELKCQSEIEIEEADDPVF